MTPVTLELTARAHAVAAKAAQPGTDEAKAAREILGLSSEPGAAQTPAGILEAFANKIEERAAVTGYARAAQERTAEDRAFSRAARRRSAHVAKARSAEGC